MVIRQVSNRHIYSAEPLLDFHESAEESPEPEDITEMLHGQQGKVTVLISIATVLDYSWIKANVILTTSNTCKLSIGQSCSGCFLLYTTKTTSTKLFPPIRRGR